MLNQTALTLNNIVWLLAAMAFVIAPHITRLPLWATAVCVGAGLWRWWIARKGLRTPRWWLMAIIALAVTAGVFLEYRRLFGREAGVALLIAMLCLKVLEMKMKRDAALIVFLGFFLAMTNFLYSQTIFMGAYMLVCVWIFVATLIGFNRIGTEPTPRERLVPSAWLLMQAIPVMLLLFFLFPRISGPLWSMPSDNQSKSGLSDTMTPGDISKLSLSDEVAFRVEFEGAVPESMDLYWRGPVLGRQVGKSWQPYNVSMVPKLNYEPQSPPINYRVTLQPHNKQWLFALDLPAITPPDSMLLADFQMRANVPVSSLKAYDMTSHLRYRAGGSSLSQRERAAYLAIDESLNPRAIAYGRKLATEQSDIKALTESLLKQFNTEFSYTLEPPLLGEHPIDEFLFDTKKGFCEHYSSSFVLVLRAAGIPARVVTGYQGGEVNPITRELIVRQADAHAWSEVWFDDLGWLRVDPTFAVSPLRINRGINAALGPQGMFNNLIEADKIGIFKQMRYSWDAVNSQWNKWVVGFNQDRQRGFLEGLGLRNFDWRDLLRWLVLSLVAIGAIATAVILWQTFRSRADPLVAAYAKLCNKLARAGIARAPHEGPLDYLHRIEAGRPDLAEKIRPLLQTYITLRYREPYAVADLPSAYVVSSTEREKMRTARQKLRKFTTSVRVFRA
jgi:protein-glutamine gamma-glutamyltransferase